MYVFLWNVTVKCGFLVSAFFMMLFLSGTFFFFFIKMHFSVSNCKQLGDLRFWGLSKRIIVSWECTGGDVRLTSVVCSVKSTFLFRVFHPKQRSFIRLYFCPDLIPYSFSIFTQYACTWWIGRNQKALKQLQRHRQSAEWAVKCCTVPGLNSGFTRKLYQYFPVCPQPCPVTVCVRSTWGWCQ